jgi:hypothetical protein
MQQQALKVLANPAIDYWLFERVSSKQMRLEAKYTAED